MCAIPLGETLRGRQFIGAMWKKRDANEAWIHPQRDGGRVLNGAGIRVSYIGLSIFQEGSSDFLKFKLKKLDVCVTVHHFSTTM